VKSHSEAFEMAEDEAPLKSVGEVVPSPYYDLIARVCAGVPFVLLLVNQQAEKLKPLTSAVGPAVRFCWLYFSVPTWTAIDPFGRIGTLK
jgi:hypothetical protein